MLHDALNDLEHSTTRTERVCALNAVAKEAKMLFNQDLEIILVHDGRILTRYVFNIQDIQKEGQIVDTYVNDVLTSVIILKTPAQQA